MLIPMMVLILSNCAMLKGALKDAKTEKLIKDSDILVYALLDAKPESEKFMQANAGKTKLDKNKVKRISAGLKKLSNISDPAKAKTVAMKLFGQVKDVGTRAAGGDYKLAVYSGDLIDMVSSFKRLFDEWDKIPGNITGGKGALTAWDKFLKDGGKGGAAAPAKKAAPKKKKKKKKKKKR